MQGREHSLFGLLIGIIPPLYSSTVPIPFSEIFSTALSKYTYPSPHPNP